jgi:phosphate transport system substrate-binding protein
MRFVIKKDDHIRMTLNSYRYTKYVGALVLLSGVLLSGVANAQDLQGAGSTFVNPIMTHWTADYQKANNVSINYQPVGSGAGINDLISKTVDFAGSDAPMNAGQLTSAGSPVLHLPDVIGAVPVVYNVEGVGPGINLSGDVIANIFLGRITKWNDPAITSLNPATKFPDASIFVVHRSDGSGTTGIFTDYLARVSPEWKSIVGEGTAVKWPAGLGGKGSAGVAALMRTHANSIGYVELSYAVQNVIYYASVQNAKGKFIYPSPETAAAEAANIKIPADFRTFFTDGPSATGYPISGFSWLIIYQNSPKLEALKKFITWVLNDGQSYCKDLDYASIPESVKVKELAALNALK